MLREHCLWRNRISKSGHTAPAAAGGFSACPLLHSYKLLYIPPMVYVLHCFQKAAQETSQKDIKPARKRYMELMRTQP